MSESIAAASSLGLHTNRADDLVQSDIYFPDGFAGMFVISGGDVTIANGSSAARRGADFGLVTTDCGLLTADSEVQWRRRERQSDQPGRLWQLGDHPGGTIMAHTCRPWRTAATAARRRSDGRLARRKVNRCGPAEGEG